MPVLGGRLALEPAAFTRAIDDSRSAFDCSVVSTGELDSSITFWLRRCTEQSRTPGAQTVPYWSAITCLSLIHI